MNKRTILLVALVVLSMVGAASANGAATAGSGNPALTTAGDDYAILSEAQDHDIVSIADVTLQPGTTTTVPIRLLNSTDVGGITVTLTFNPSVVNVLTGVAGVFDSNSSLDYSNVSDGVMRVTGVKFGEDMTGDLTIATVTLKAVGTSGSCELGLSAELSNRIGGDVLPTIDNGTFTISGRTSGDVDTHECLDARDVSYLAKHVAEIPGYETLYGDGDVDTHEGLDARDVSYLAKHVAEIPGYETLY